MKTFCCQNCLEARYFFPLKCWIISTPLCRLNPKILRKTIAGKNTLRQIVSRRKKLRISTAIIFDRNNFQRQKFSTTKIFDGKNLWRKKSSTAQIIRWQKSLTVKIFDSKNYSMELFDGRSNQVSLPPPYLHVHMRTILIIIITIIMISKLGNALSPRISPARGDHAEGKEESLIIICARKGFSIIWFS